MRPPISPTLHPDDDQRLAEWLIQRLQLRVARNPLIVWPLGPCGQTRIQVAELIEAILDSLPPDTETSTRSGVSLEQLQHFLELPTTDESVLTLAQHYLLWFAQAGLISHKAITSSDRQAIHLWYLIEPMAIAHRLCEIPCPSRAEVTHIFSSLDRK